MIQLVVSSFVISFVVLVGLTIFSTIMHPDWFNPAVFGSGFAAIIGATGAVHICHGRYGQPPGGPTQ